MMTEWKKVKLGELCNTISDTYHLSHKKVVLINTSDVLDGKILNHIEVENKNLKGQFKKTFQKSDILYSEIRPANRRFAFVDIENTDNYIASTKLMVLRPNLNKVLPKFLFMLLKSNEVIDELQHLAETRSGTFPQITFSSELAPMEVMLPPLPTQKKIAEVLSCLDAKIELNRRINENLEQQAGAIFKEWFVDFGPFAGKMPDDWKEGTINDLADEIVCGKTPSTKVKEFYGYEIPFITIPDMHNSVYVTNTERYLSKLGANSQINKMLPPNCVCVSCIGTAGLVILTSTPSQTNQQINSIIPRKGFSPFYIYFLMKSKSEVINKLGQCGSTIVNLNKVQFSKLDVLIPSLDIMKEYNEIVSPMFKTIFENQRQSQILVQIRDTLLPKLMSGEIEV